MLLNDWLSDPSADRGVHVADGADGWTYRPYTELAAAAAATAAHLRAARIAPGANVMLLFARQADFIAGFFGTLGAGCTPVPVAPPAAFGNGARYSAHLTTLMHRSGCAAVLVDDSTAAVATTTAATCAPVPAVLRVGAEPADAPARPDARAIPDLALLQFTSGSSGTPKGVRVTRDNLCANVSALHRWMGMSAGDSSALWLPHYHDMGLMSLLLGVTSQIPLWLMTPQQFIRDPLRWLRCLGEDGATLTGGPPFGYLYAARRVQPEQLAGMDFSPCRVAVLGAERIDPAAVAEFVRAVEPFGFRTAALMPAYGMAETTLIAAGVTVGEESLIRELSEPTVRIGEPVKFGATGILGADAPHTGTWLTECGTPAAGTRIEIIDESGNPLPEGYLGEIRVHGTSVTAGYHHGDADPGGPDDRFAGGGFRTGDSGVLVEGSLFVIGRIGDSLKVRGAAVHAEDVELEIARELGLVTSQVAVLLGTLDLVDTAVIVVQADLDDDLVSRITTLMAARTSDAVALVIVRATSGAIQRTSSGKPRRRVMWQVVTDGRLPGMLVHTTWRAVAPTPPPWETHTTIHPDGDAA
ncbi:AMP-binding protein [Nocardia sp. alder85J]|uniref:AMP-binding protein n=1 Tax=Nocardia sp. alder85J TaxID=2862949 RepID=UPI001CD7030D|nr:AMP-binding protein [Nocardia sp. alder85J]MCX4098515.1 AMP-binding protein [Nocardia sp. alder85J]